MFAILAVALHAFTAPSSQRTAPSSLHAAPSSLRHTAPLAALRRRDFVGGAAAMQAALLAAVPQSSSAISATTMSGKTKPELGIILVDEVKAVGKTGISGDVVLEDRLVAQVTFDTPWPLAEGGYYDLEAKSRDGGECAFLQVSKAPKGKSVANAPKTFFTDTIFSTEGRYGAYGAPTDIKVLSDTTAGDVRKLEVSFVALTPGGTDVARRGVVAATQPAGGGQILMLTASTGASKWKKGGKEEALRAADTFAVTTRSSELAAVPQSDYRYGKTSGPSNMSSRNDGF